MCALPLPEVLGDFEDAIRKISLAIVKISSSNLIHKQIPLIFLLREIRQDKYENEVVGGKVVRLLKLMKIVLLLYGVLRSLV